jgi:hypothetical protein
MAIDTIQSTLIPRIVRGLNIKINVPARPQSVNPEQVAGLIPLKANETDCRGVLDGCIRVFADSASTDSRKNDLSYFAVDFPDDTIGNVFEIEQFNGSIWTTVNTPFSWGTYYDENTWDAHQTRQAVCIDWRVVLLANGAGVYRLNVNNELFSYAFDLKQFNCNTDFIRLESTFNGLFGKLDSSGRYRWNIADGEQTWTEQIRLKGGFGREVYETETELYQFENEVQRTNKREFKQSFRLDVYSDLKILRRLVVYGFAGNDIKITEYNEATDKYYTDFNILIDGSAEPDYTPYSNKSYHLYVNVIRSIDNLGYRACL